MHIEAALENDKVMGQKIWMLIKVYYFWKIIASELPTNTTI